MNWPTALVIIAAMFFGSVTAIGYFAHSKNKSQQ